MAAARQYKSELLERMFGLGAFAAEAEPGVTVLLAGSNVVGADDGAKIPVGAAVSDELAVRALRRNQATRRLEKIKTGSHLR